jgi:hypothetical protein
MYVFGKLRRRQKLGIVTMFRDAQPSILRPREQWWGMMLEVSSCSSIIIITPIEPGLCSPTQSTRLALPKANKTSESRYSLGLCLPHIAPNEHRGIRNDARASHCACAAASTMAADSPMLLTTPTRMRNVDGQKLQWQDWHMTDPTSRQRGRPQNDKTVTFKKKK